MTDIYFAACSLRRINNFCMRAYFSRERGYDHASTIVPAKIMTPKKETIKRMAVNAESGWVNWMTPSGGL